MIPFSGSRLSWLPLAITLSLAVFAGADSSYGQHGGHAPSAPHASAPAPRASAPRPVTAHPPDSSGARVQITRPFEAIAARPQPPVLPRPARVANPFRPQQTASGPIFHNTTIGFPAASSSNLPLITNGAAIGGNKTIFGDGHHLWVEHGQSGRDSTGQLPISGLRRRHFPVSVRPIAPPLFFPGIVGFGWGPGFGRCDPFWGWNWGCGYPYGGYLLGGYYGGYLMPSEPYYEPVPSDGNADDSSGEIILYLKDGSVHLILNDWLEDNQLHYLTSDGSEHAISMDQIDLQKTVDVNDRRGQPFVLRAGSGSTPNDSTIPSATPDHAPAPEQQ